VAAALLVVAFLLLLLDGEGEASLPEIGRVGGEAIHLLGTVGVAVVGVLVVLLVALVSASYLSCRPPPERPGPSAEERHRAGCAWLRRELRRRGPRTVAQLESRWPKGRAPKDLADWVATELARGRIVATVGPDRLPRIQLPGDRRSPVPPGVTVDRQAFLDALERHRRLSEGRGEMGETPPSDQDGSRPTRS
jgi:hypothetical protein